MRQRHIHVFVASKASRIFGGKVVGRLLRPRLSGSDTYGNYFDHSRDARLIVKYPETKSFVVSEKFA